MTWQWLQSAFGGSSSTSSLSVSSSSPVSSGSKFIAYVGSYNSTPSSVKDAAGNSLTLIMNYYVNVDTTPSFLPLQFSVYIMDTPSGDAGADVTLTARFGGSTSAAMGIQEVSGLQTGTTTSLDYGVGDTGYGYGVGETVTDENNAAVISYSYSPSVNNEYMVSCLCYEASASLTSPSGWTADANINAFDGVGLAVAYVDSSTSSGSDGPWAFPSSSNGNCWIAFAFAFNPPAGPIPVRTNFRRQAVKRAAYY